MGAHPLWIKDGLPATKKKFALSNSLLVLIFEQDQQLIINRSHHLINQSLLKKVLIYLLLLLQKQILKNGSDKEEISINKSRNLNKSYSKEKAEEALVFLAIK